MEIAEAHLCPAEKRKTLTSELLDVEKELQQKLKEGEERIQLLLKAANIHFLLGHTRNCEQTLKQVCFSSFDFREWIVENNQLVCRLQKTERVVPAKEFGEIFCNLVQKIQGLPPIQEHIVEELTITCNCSIIFLTEWAAGHDAMSQHRSTAVLISGICRATVALLPSQQQKGNWIRYNGDELQKVFCPSTSSQVMGWVKNILASLHDREKMELSGLLESLVISCVILAIHWMSQDQQVHQARELLLTVNKYLNNTSTLQGSRTLEKTEGETQTPRVFVVQGSGPLQRTISSSKNQVYTSEDLADITCLLLAFTHYLLEEREQAMEILRKTPHQEANIKYSWLYLQGYLHFVNHEFSLSLKCFQDAIKVYSLENYQKAAALNMIGCCCAENNKPHTAIQKFKEALECDFCQLAPLYNISIQYRKLANFEAEISSLKMLVEALQAACSESLVDGTDDVCLRSSHMSGENLQEHHQELAVPRPVHAFLSVNHSSCCGCSIETVMYTFGKRCLELDRFSEAADTYLDLLTIALESDVLPSGLIGVIDPNPSLLYQECVYSLLCDGRYEDTVTVCDRALHTFIENKPSSQQRKRLQDNQNVCNTEMSKPSKKRLRESVSVDDGENESSYTNALPQNAILLMYKADALVQLGEPVKALACLDRCLDTLCQHQLETDTQETLVEHTEIIQSQKRQRIDDKGKVATLTGNERNKGFKVSIMAQTQAQAWNNKAVIVLSMGRYAEALQMLCQALRCDPSHSESLFNHTLLLWKLGKNTEGACNWLKFRGFDINMDKQTRSHSSFLSKLRECPLPGTHGKISAAQLQRMDRLAVKYWWTS